MRRLQSLWEKEERIIIGLMSGTSVDGVDAVLLKVSGFGIETQYELVEFITYPFPPSLREKIFTLFNPTSSSVDQLCSVNFELGLLFAEAVKSLLLTSEYTKETIDLIGSHGQTFYHIPEDDKEKALVRSTMQLGEASILAEQIGCPVVFDFRVRDMAAGGGGAPLVPYIDYILYRSDNKNIALQNIGGIGNVTFLPQNGHLDDVIAFDTGPGNMMIDAAIEIITNGKRTFDKDGELASKGRVDLNYVDRLMKDDYFFKQIPKSTGRERYGVDFTKEVVGELKTKGLATEDVIATITRFTAQSIFDQYSRFITNKYDVDELIVSGGGAYNKTLLRDLNHFFAETNVKTQDDIGNSNDAKEAIAFALLANDTIYGYFNNVPSATGARKPVVLGKVSL